MRWFMIKKRKRIFTTPPSLLLQRPRLVSLDTWEKGGNKCRRCLSFEPDRSEVLSQRSQVPIFLRSEEEGEGGAGEGVKEDRWRWRRAKKSSGRREAERVKEQECGIVRHFLCFWWSGLIFAFCSTSVSLAPVSQRDDAKVFSTGN